LLGRGGPCVIRTRPRAFGIDSSAFGGKGHGNDEYGPGSIVQIFGRCSRTSYVYLFRKFPSLTAAEKYWKGVTLQESLRKVF
jgi:hypothetical protein